jgi:hypothetical protein
MLPVGYVLPLLEDQVPQLLGVGAGGGPDNISKIFCGAGTAMSLPPQQNKFFVRFNKIRIIQFFL